MSTRAIIAIPTPKGFITAWNWNDGGPENLGHELKKYFKSKSQVMELINAHSFNIVCGDELKDELMRLYPKWNTEENYTKLSNGRYIKQEPFGGKVVAGSGKYGFFHTLKDMLDQDLNYVYVFNDGEWEMYK